ncbi:MAG TPA: phosphomannomutase/phosphoglucomutase [Candidatus Bathyarchaeia archaeon]|nr:phosphomannomutase/phosphoglucomutase [Candidatus Bathyarchaeia archaeon]
MSIFKAYDIRGIYPSEIDERVAYRIGAAFGTLNHGKIAVGCDTRLSSPQLKEHFINGAILTGSEILNIGIVTTPIVVFAIKHFNCDGGVNITASHNPREYNGFKLFDENAMPISYESGIGTLKAVFESENYRKGNGSSSTRAIKEDYINFILTLARVKIGNRLSVVIDGSNGAAGLYAPEIYRRLGMTVNELNCTADGNFPGHNPDPSKEENLLDAKSRVKEAGADLGFVYDGDGDRLAVIDKDGTAIESSRIFSLLVRHLLEEKPGTKIVHDVLMSGMAIDTIKRYGGLAIPCRVGHTYIAQKMMEEAAELGGELSGHYYFKETFFADDAILASLKIVKLVSQEGKRLSELIKDFPEYPSENVRISVKDSEKFSFIKKLKEELDKEGYLVDCLDGVKVMFEDGWALFRASNTEPKISIAYESKDKEEYNKIKNFVQSIIKKVPQ